jgi:lipopolysaccharide export LptBFGC system permease protein LptF
MFLKTLALCLFLLFAILISINMLKIIEIRLRYGTFNIGRLLKLTSNEDKQKIKKYYKTSL